MLKTYHANALDSVEIGVQQGDWRMVNLMAMAYSGYGMNSAFQSLTPRNPFSAYAWLSLAPNGASRSDAQILDGYLNTTLTENNLSAAQINSAEAWASAMFQEYFIDKPPFTYEAARTCRPVQ